MSRMGVLGFGAVLLWALWWVPVASVGASGLADAIERVKPSVVGVGTFQPTRSPRAQLLGTGFAVGDGRHVITNDHVIPHMLDSENREHLAIFIPGRGESGEMRQARRVASDPLRDLTLLRFEGRGLPALRMGDSDRLREGETVALTGFPIGAVLGLVPATHTGIVSAITPIAMPVRSTQNLDPAVIRRLRDPYTVFQLDATAYPGNSGSPLYRPETGEVIGVLNMVFVKEGRERALDRPSGISYAIPGNYVRDLLREAGVSR
ncbi:MAG: S1C family serine protease [Thioalkalivibrio sp.]